MKKLSLAVTVGGALAIAAPLFAQETPKTETTKEQRTAKESKSEKMETKSTSDTSGTMNSTNDSTSLQKETKRKADGQIEERQKNDPLKKSPKSTEKTVKDSQGNVLEHEKKIEK